MTVQTVERGFKNFYHHWRFYTGVGLWIVAMFCLGVAAEGINKNQWIAIGSLPITILTIGFILPHRLHVQSRATSAHR